MGGGGAAGEYLERWPQRGLGSTPWRGAQGLGVRERGPGSNSGRGAQGEIQGEGPRE